MRLTLSPLDPVLLELMLHFPGVLLYYTLNNLVSSAFFLSFPFSFFGRIITNSINSQSKYSRGAPCPHSISSGILAVRSFTLDFCTLAGLLFVSSRGLCCMHGI